MEVCACKRVVAMLLAATLHSTKRALCVDLWWVRHLAALLHRARVVAGRSDLRETRVVGYQVLVQTYAARLTKCRSPCGTTHDHDETTGSHLPRWSCVSYSIPRRNRTHHLVAHSWVQNRYLRRRKHSAISLRCHDRWGTMLDRWPAPLACALQTRSRRYGT